MVLAGIRVLDVGSFVAGPAAATMMGDFGAEVIKIEPPEGDPYRGLHRLPGSPEGDRDYYWVLDSRNKKGLALDLKRPEAREVLERLVRSADVFVTNMPVDVRARLGIRWADLEPLNGRLDLRIAHRLWRERSRGEQDRLRRHRVVGAHGAHGQCALGPGCAARPLDSRDGRPRHRDGPVRRRDDGALPARAHRQGGHGVDLA